MKVTDFFKQSSCIFLFTENVHILSINVSFNRLLHHVQYVNIFMRTAMKDHLLRKVDKHA